VDKPLIGELKNFFLELFFPSFCFGCNKEGTLLCYDCKSTLEISEYNYCLCNKALRLPLGNNNGKCSRCQDKKLSGLYFALPYKEKFLTRKLIYQFKYKSYLVKTLAKPLVEMILEHFVLAKNLELEIWKDSIIIPVPLEKGKWKDRGYNQSEELGKMIGQSLNVLTVTHNLVKIKKTNPQMKLKAKEREGNVRNAFKIKNPQEIAGRKVFLVDDVYTTGSTMEECAKILKEAGAKQVWGICIAREG
jgi:ComF family protein